MAETKALTELKSFLNKLFQFESQDLDFGIYKILHYKRKEVKEFIDKLLTDKVKEQLQVFDAEQKRQLESELKELEADESIQNYNKALTTDKAEAEILYKYNKKNIDQYLKLKKQVSEVQKTNNTEETIYNHLTLFFSRYYDKGDFISKRRFGKNEKYVVPYNGEETHFYWANHDQYYIKSSEYFQQFAFKVPQLKGTLTVNFKLTDAQTEQGNVKAEENKYFILSEKKPELTDTELNIFFEFRSLTETEKKSLNGNGKQDLLNEKAIASLKEQLGKKDATAKLWEEDDKEQSLLLRKLHHYTRKNSYDFFIHKDLNGFLQRELDFYIKSELVKVEDLYVLDSEQHFDNIRHNFKLIKCFKNIADTIIDFLAQIEDFQKKLWEKKKFVLSTEWVITIDKLAACLDKEPFEALVKKVLDNQAQVEEWKQLFGWEKLPFALTLVGLKTDLHSWHKLPVDTKHFDDTFKKALLNGLSEKINIEEITDGLAIHSDNYHGLKLLYPKYSENIKSVYIDPPYNTGSDGFLYKDSFFHSSWISMLIDRIRILKDLLLDEGGFFVQIDYKEIHNLKKILDIELGNENFVQLISIKTASPAGFKTVNPGPIDVTEYLLFFTKDKSKFQFRKDFVAVEYDTNYNLYIKNPHDEAKKWKLVSIIDKFYEEEGVKDNADAKKKWGDNWKIIRDILIGEFALINRDRIVSKRDPHKPTEAVKKLLEESKNKDYVIEHKRDESGSLYIYQGGSLSFYSNKVKEIDGKITPTELLTDFWDDISWAGIANEGGVKLKNGKKPERLIKRIMDLSTNKNDIIIDFFAGSGTTLGAAKKYGRKWIGIETGQYFESHTLKRLKYTISEDKTGIAATVGYTGGGFFKYQRLEQYEEALENIAFTTNEKTVQQAMTFDSYMPKYFLELETRGSKTLVNIEAMQNPWAYTLKVWDGFTYDNEQVVDLVETFNYLIGLHVQKQFTWEDDNKKYVFVWGWNNEQKKALVVWRDTTGWKEKDYEADRTYIESKLKQFEYDTLFINGQSTLPGYLMIEDIFKTKMIPA